MKRNTDENVNDSRAMIEGYHLKKHKKVKCLYLFMTFINHVIDNLWSAHTSPQSVLYIPKDGKLLFFICISVLFYFLSAGKCLRLINIIYYITWSEMFHAFWINIPTKLSLATVMISVKNILNFFFSFYS